MYVKLRQLGDTEVEIVGKREEVTALFHAVNRTLSLLDDLDHSVQTGIGADVRDFEAYHHVNDFIAKLQRELDIKPEDDDG